MYFEWWSIASTARSRLQVRVRGVTIFLMCKEVYKRERCKKVYIHELCKEVYKHDLVQSLAHKYI